MFNLAYLAYGASPNHQLELTYSVLSVLRFLQQDPPDIRILLICDEANRRPDLPVDELIIPDLQLREWQMDGQYAHAAKPNALAHVLRRFGLPTVLIDTDTILNHHPDQLFARLAPSKALLHTCEGPLSALTAQAAAWKQLIEGSGGRIADYPVSWSTKMYNSGVIGLCPQDVAVLEDSLRLIEAIRAEVEVFTAEQLAVSIASSSRLEIATCEDLVTHYWEGPRAYFRYQMARAFPGVADGGGLATIPEKLPELRTLPPYRADIALRARLLRTRRGGDAAYAHAWLCAQSALRHSNDSALANAWAENALNMLLYAVHRPHPQITQDFAAFGPTAQTKLAWLNPALSRRWQDFWATVESA